MLILIDQCCILVTDPITLPFTYVFVNYELLIV